jgi:hypothetical protein
VMLLMMVQSLPSVGSDLCHCRMKIVKMIRIGLFPKLENEFGAIFRFHRHMNPVSFDC